MKPIIFTLVIISQILFLWFENIQGLFVHPITGESVSKIGFIWHMGNFMPVILLSFMSIFGDRKWTITTIVFTVLSVLDYVDWILEGNNIWWHNGIIPVSMNTLTGFVFAVSFMYEFMRYGKSGRIKL